MNISYLNLESSFGEAAGAGWTRLHLRLAPASLAASCSTRSSESHAGRNPWPSEFRTKEQEQQNGLFSLPNSGESSLSRGSPAFAVQTGLKVDSREIAHWTRIATARSACVY